MKNKINYIRLFISFYLFLTSIALLLMQSQIIYTKHNTLQVLQTISSSNFSLGYWLMQKIKKPLPPLKIIGETWLPPNSSQTPYILSLNFILESVINEESHELDIGEPKRNTKIPIQDLDEILSETTHSIYIANISNSYLFNKLDSVFNFKGIELIQVPRVRREIASLVNRLKFSGYFSQIRLFYNTHKNTIIFTLELQLNPILNKIEFLNVDNLLIPVEDLQELSAEQIGYPKSFHQLTLLTKNIQHWYACRGYNWIHIKVMGDSVNPGEIVFQIQEGILDKITYKLCPLVNHEISKKTNINKFIPTNFIDEILDLYLKRGRMPTLYNIEKAMHAIKETRFFYNSYYDVKFPTVTDKIELIIHFVPYRDNETHTIIEKIIKKISPINQTEEEIQNLVNYLLQKNSKIQNLIINQFTPYLSFHKLAQKYIYSEKLLTLFDHMFLSLDNKTMLDSELGVDENNELYQHHSKIYFFHSLRYLGQKYNFTTFTLNENDHTSQYNFSYDIPLAVNKSTISPLATRIFDNVTLVKPEELGLFLNKLVRNKRFLNSPCELQRTGIELFYKRKFSGGVNLSSTIATRLIFYDNLFFQREHLLLNYLRQKISFYSQMSEKTSLLLSRLKQNFTFRKNLKNLILQDFKIWSLRIQLPCLDDLYHPTIGHFTQVDFLQFRSNLDLIKIKNSTPNSQRIELYFLKHVSYFRNRPKYSNSPYHFLFFKIFIGKLFGNKLMFSLPDRLRYQKYNVSQSGYDHLRRTSNFFGEYLIEYHFRIFKYTNPVIFFKYIQDSSLLEEYPFPHIQGELFYSKRLHLSPISSGKYIGIAWEFRTIIPQIPPIKIEFIQKIPGRGKFYLRVTPYLY